jgi:hypothetical protein
MNWEERHFWNDTEGRTKVLGEIPVGIPFYSKRIPYGLA